MKLEEPSGPLVGLRVLDLTRGRAGAIAGMLLADYGADVLRIEPPGGDPLWDELPGYAVWHRGKDVVEIDLQQPDAQVAIRKRLPVADVFLNGLRSGALERVGLGHASVAEIAPKLVYATVSGFGPGADDLPALEGLPPTRARATDTRSPPRIPPRALEPGSSSSSESSPPSTNARGREPGSTSTRRWSTVFFRSS